MLVWSLFFTCLPDRMRVPMKKSYHIAIVGATGAVGIELLSVLERRGFPVKTLRPLASARSAGKFKTIRFEVDILNSVVYQRKGRAWVWISDDAKRLPVQIRLRMSFPVGTVTLGLEKEGTE